jgi:predicted nucleic acid-binding protein
MSIIDTSLLIDKVSEGKEVRENISVMSAIEYPMVLEYKKFYGKVLDCEKQEFALALELQERLRKIGRMKTASDLIIAATCISNKEELLTKDSDFYDIAKVSELKIA